MITDPTIIKDGKEIKKISLLFIDESPKLLDGYIQIPTKRNNLP